MPCCTEKCFNIFGVLLSMTGVVAGTFCVLRHSDVQEHSLNNTARRDGFSLSVSYTCTVPVMVILLDTVLLFLLYLYIILCFI